MPSDALSRRRTHRSAVELFFNANSLYNRGYHSQKTVT